MKDEQVAKYPDYLLEFEEIYALAQWQKSVITGINSTFDWVMKNLKLKLAVNDEWHELLCDTLGTSDEEDLKLLHQRFPVTTMEILEKYIRIWLPEHRASLEYDKDTLTVKMKIIKAADKPRVRKWTRNILPCNLLLEIEVVEELG